MTRLSQWGRIVVAIVLTSGLPGVAQDRFEQKVTKGSIVELLVLYDAQANSILPILVPDEAGKIMQVVDSGQVVFDDLSRAFPADFLARLSKKGIVDEHYPVVCYPLLIILDEKTHDYLLLAYDGEELLRVARPKDYDPLWYAKEHFLTLGVKASRKEFLAFHTMFSPARIAGWMTLINPEAAAVVAKVDESELQALLATPPSMPHLMMGLGGSCSNDLHFAAIVKGVPGSNDVQLTIGYPSALYGVPLDIVSCDDLIDWSWSVAISTNIPSGTNFFDYFISPASTNREFFACYRTDLPTGDTDGDGVPDGEEKYLDGTDTDDENDPANIKGSISYPIYSGGQLGLIHVVAVTNLVSDGWSTNVGDSISVTGAYHIIKVPHDSYYVRAWRDSDGNGIVGTYEATGTYSTAAIAVSNQWTGIDIVLHDPDTDDDGVPDWWEIEYGFDPNDASDNIADPDGDLLPNVYEWYHGFDPLVADSDQVPRLRVDLSGIDPAAYTTINAALDASSAYSIIELGSGHYFGDDNVGSILPDHPLMITSGKLGAERSAVLHADHWAMAIQAGHDNRTIIRGLTIMIGGSSAPVMGIYIGTGLYPFEGATPLIDGVSFIQASEQFSYGIYVLGHADGNLILNNCYFRSTSAGGDFRGVYLVDGPDAILRNCTFSNMKTSSVGLFAGFTEGNWGAVPGTNFLTAGACFWDSSFSPTGGVPVLIADGAIECVSSISNSVMPYVPTNYMADVTGGVLVTNADVLVSGHLASSNSPCIDAATVASISWYDFEGRARGVAPDIGVDEYSPFGTEDSDGDGLSDLQEVQVYFTGIHDPDSDQDNVPDGREVSCGTSPFDPANYCVAVLGSVSNETSYGSGVTTEASFSYVFGEWNASNSVSVSSNNAFLLEHVTVTNNCEWWVQVHCDLNTNGVWDSFDALIQSRVNILAATNKVVLVMGQDSVVDRDGDGMPDAWEATYGLSWTNALDIHEDTDGDGLDSLWEYELGLNPTVINTGYVHCSASLAIDERIEGKSPSTALPLFSLQDHAHTNYVRNTNCWAADLDLTCASPWNSQSANQRAGTLISPRHLIFAEHSGYSVLPGHTLRFVDSTNGVVERVVMERRRIGTTDISISILDNDVPTNRITFAKVLPVDFRNYMGDGERLPVIRFDQEEKALVGNVRALTSPPHQALIFCDYPPFGERAAFSEKIIGGDSGNPCFLVINETPVVITTWFGGGAGSGPPVTEHRDSINEAMEVLSNGQGITNGYQLSDIDLSGFIQIYDLVTPSSAGGISVSETVDESGQIPLSIITYTNE